MPLTTIGLPFSIDPADRAKNLCENSLIRTHAPIGEKGLPAHLDSAAKADIIEPAADVAR
jgi:hypothetical protein